MTNFYVSKDSIVDGVQLFKVMKVTQDNINAVTRFAADAKVERVTVTENLLDEWPLDDHIGEECMMVSFEGQTTPMICGNYLVKAIGKCFCGGLELADCIGPYYITVDEDEFNEQYVPLTTFCRNMMTAVASVA